MDLWIEEGKWFLKISSIRTKWNCEEKIWITHARKFLWKWFGSSVELISFMI
jgi:hypothetical protein